MIDVRPLLVRGGPVLFLLFLSSFFFSALHTRVAAVVVLTGALFLYVGLF